MELPVSARAFLLFSVILAAPSGTSARPGPVPPVPASAASAEPIHADPPVHPALPAVSFPHPLIVEVLYAVPTGSGGDANQDGTRHAGGDEFIEIVNPHDRPIQLLGYTLADGGQKEKSRMRFTFPACELAPGGVAVVFNGNQAAWSGAVGDAKAAPPKGNDKFNGAMVFTMRNSSSAVALGNQGDELTLTTPSAKTVQRLRWGTAADGGKPDPGIPLDETLPTTNRCSVERTGFEIGAPWRPHTDFDKRLFSPGESPSQHNAGTR